MIARSKSDHTEEENQIMFKSGPSIQLCLLISITFNAVEAANNLDTIKRNAIRVYLDCRCDRYYIRNEITYVNYIEEQSEAQVYILQTEEKTSGNGRLYTLFFIGQDNFAGKRDTLQYNTFDIDTNDIRRRKLARMLKIGLMPYVAKTAAVDFINISFDKKLMPTAVIDDWDSWVFNLSLNTRINGEEQHTTSNLWSRISADRITPDLKIRMKISGSYDQDEYDLDDGTNIISSTQQWSIQAAVTKSISEHWSAGAWADGSSSSVHNIKNASKVTPAIEYNYYPYSEYNRRELRFVYTLGYENVQYVDTTIFNKISESLLEQTFRINLRMKETWGDVDLSMDANNYLHDKDLYKISLNGNLRMKLFKGLSLDFRGSVSLIQNQLSLEKNEYETEDILLGTRQLATDYSYWGMVGFSYRFGSIYSNVVNSRFGN